MGSGDLCIGQGPADGDAGDGLQVGGFQLFKTLGKASALGGMGVRANGILGHGSSYSAGFGVSFCCHFILKLFVGDGWVKTIAFPPRGMSSRIYLKLGLKIGWK